MANLHISRAHALGLPQARKIAFRWAEQAESELGMTCTYEEGATHDVVGLTRSGVSGHLRVSNDRFELDLKLGFLLGAFKDRIEAEIVKNLDALLHDAKAGAAHSKAPTKVTAKVTAKAPVKTGVIPAAKKAGVKPK